VIDRRSRYQFSEIHTDSAGRRFFGPRPRFTYRDLPDNQRHIVKGAERLWHLSQIYWPELPKNGTYYWIIADFQPEPILDAFKDLVMGSVIIVPSLRTVEGMIFNSARARTVTL
jgi:hypothetical protein